MKTKEQFIINKKNWKMAMKINPIRSERRCKCSGSVRRILSAHLGHRLCNGRCFGGSPSSAYFFLQIMQKSMSFSMSMSVGDGIFFCGVFDLPRLSHDSPHAHFCTMAAHNEHNVISCKISFVYRRLEV